MWLRLLLCCLFSCALAKPFDDDPVCGYDACPVADTDSLNVHIVPHSHDDVGWTKTVDQYYYQQVESIISSVVRALKQNPDRRYVQVETAFFKIWWEVQSDATRQTVIDLVNNGQFEIINGGWSMNDEAGVNYQFTIDQYTLGLRYLEDRLGKCSRPTVGWQIDPFGHSREHASINAQLGFDSIFFARLDYRDKINRMDTKTGDLIWRGSNSLGNESDIFTSVLYNHYSAPSGFCFDIKCTDEPIIDDEESPDFNHQRRVEEFTDFIKEQASKFPTNNIMILLGDDFRYQAALTSYINTDRLIKGFELFPQTFEDKPIKVFYSTPSCYTKAVNDYVLSNDYKLQIKTDDFLPYADRVATLIVGYYTSRPASKRFVREGNVLLQTAKQLASVANKAYDNENINELKEAMGIMQHHDAITGTELNEVARDYHRILYKAHMSASNEVSPILSNLISGGSDDDFKFQSCLLSNVSSCPVTKSDSFTLAVYNPSSWTVSAPISVPVDSKTWTIVNSNGDNVTYQVEDTIRDFSQLITEETSKYSLEFTAKDLPPFGFKVYTFSKSDGFEPTKISQAKNMKIGNDDTSFEIDGDSGLLKSVTMNGITLDVKQELLFYTSGGRSQCWVFEPDDKGSQQIADKVTTSTIEGDIYSAVVQEYSDWAKQIIKVYHDDSSYIEFDWIVGPLDIENGGKEVISRFSTSLKSNSTYYTDSNGRETITRIKNYRPDYEYTDEAPIPGNYYPVTAKLMIKDEENGNEFAVLTDRSEGGSSLEDGQIELMMHRRVRHNDDYGLDEEEYGHGIVVRGRHFLVLGPSTGGDKTLTVVQKEIIQKKLLEPWVFLTKNDVSSKLTNKVYSNLKNPLAENVQILTLEPWSENTLLLRLEHILEKDDDNNLSQEVTVDLSDLFVAFTINELQEMTLAGNIPLAEKTRLHWPGSEKAQTKIQNVDDMKVTLAPMQIRTFLAKVTYNNSLSK